jgi:hypothetical protein
MNRRAKVFQKGVLPGTPGRIGCKDSATAIACNSEGPAPRLVCDWSWPLRPELVKTKKPISNKVPRKQPLIALTTSSRKRSGRSGVPDHGRPLHP